MDKIKTWIFGSPESLPNKKHEQARQTDYVKPETQLEEKTVQPQALVRATINACKEDELVVSSISVSPQEEEFDFSAFQRTVPGKLLLTCLMTGGLYSVSRHGSYLCKKKNIMRLHHKALSVVLLGCMYNFLIRQTFYKVNVIDLYIRNNSILGKKCFRNIIH